MSKGKELRCSINAQEILVKGLCSESNAPVEEFVQDVTRGVGGSQVVEAQQDCRQVVLIDKGERSRLR